VDAWAAIFQSVKTNNKMHSSSSKQQVHQTQAIYLIEKIIRTRIYQSLYWKESCFGLNAETILDKAVQLSSIGGQYSNQRPSNFLCLVMKLLQLQPELEIALFYLEQTEYKYLRALGAFYLRLTAKETHIYKYLEPLLYDRRKLRMRTATG
jgi:pre-mRNA-splicing factor 38A